MIAADSMGLSAFIFKQLFSKTKERSSRFTYALQNLAWNSHSRSFKVTCFGVIGKPTRDSVLLYNIASLISEDSEEIPSENTENCRCWQRYCRLTPAVQGNPANISVNLILPETRIPSRWRYGLIFVLIFVTGSEIRTFCATECVVSVQGHRMSLILTSIESLYATSY